VKDGHLKAKNLALTVLYLPDSLDRDLRCTTGENNTKDETSFRAMKYLLKAGTSFEGYN
jgi:hypothetical protein